MCKEEPSFKKTRVFALKKCACSFKKTDVFQFEIIGCFYG